MKQRYSSSNWQEALARGGDTAAVNCEIFMQIIRQYEKRPVRIMAKYEKIKVNLHKKHEVSYG